MKRDVPAAQTLGHFRIEYAHGEPPINHRWRIAEGFCGWLQFEGQALYHVPE